MPITTQTIAKANVQKSKGKAKPKAKQPKATKRSLKRVASESDPESEEEETEPKAKKRNAKRRHTAESGSEVEIIDDVEPSGKAVESVDGQSAGEEVPEVSTDHLFYLRLILTEV